MQPQRILITGGAGFIGSHSVDLFLRQGKEVIVLDNLVSGKESRLDKQHPNLEFIEGDVLEFPLVKELVDKVDAVLHLAAIASVQESFTNPIYSFQVNVQGALHVLEAVRQVDSKIRVALASSAAVYGDSSDLPYKEQKIGLALSPYALHKIQIEEFADLYHRLHGINTISLRYFNVYGEGQDATSPYSGVISRFLDAYQMHETCKIFGDGKQSRDFIHVTDIASANLLALQNDYHGAMNIATGKPHSLLELIKTIEEISGKKLTVQNEDAKLGDIRHSYADVELAQKKLQFKAKISLSEGMRQMMDRLFV